MTPFSCEHIYRKLFAKGDESVFMNKWPKVNARMVNKDLEKDINVAQAAITASLNSREKAGISLRWPVAKVTIEVTDDAAYTALEKLSTMVEDYANAKRIELKRVSGMKREVRPVFAKLGPDFKENAGAVASALRSADAEEITKAIDRDGYYSLHTDSGTADIKPEHFTTVERVEEGDAVVFKYGKAQ